LRHGIPEIPYDVSDPIALRRSLSEMRNALLRIESSRQPPAAPTNLAVTPVAGGNVVQFTRSGADRYILYASKNADIGNAVAIDLGLAVQYQDDVGKSAVARYYWVKGIRGDMSSDFAGPVTGTTLALTTEATLPAAPPAFSSPTTSDATGKTTDGSGGGRQYL